MMLLSTRSILAPKGRTLFASSFRLQSIASSSLVGCCSLGHPHFYLPNVARCLSRRSSAVTQRSLSQGNEEEDMTNRNRLEYQHSFHAGNFADVVKHVILVMLLQHMQKKSKPIGYVETHAGAGLYSLQVEEKNYETEHQRGIYQLLDQLPKSANLSSPIATYLDIVQSFRGDSSSAGLIYPGSPLFAASLLKEQPAKNGAPHSMLLYEKAPAPHHQLQTHLKAAAQAGIQIRTHCDNGYTQLAQHAQSTSNLPARALVLIDPPYQYGSDTDQIVALCSALHRHWRSARIAIWHPVRADHAEKLERLYGMLRQSVEGDILTIEAYPPAVEEGRKEDVGTGMILIKPPYGIEEECRKEVLPQLLDLLYPKEEGGVGDGAEAAIRVEWL